MPTTGSAAMLTLSVFCGLAASVAGAPVKTAQTLLTPADIARLRSDPAEKARALNSPGPGNYMTTEYGPAAFWVEQSDDFIWRQLIPTTVRRVQHVGQPDEPGLGCPVHGQEIWKHGGHFPWIMSVKLPGKLTCPVGGESYPSNDYLAGDLTHGAYADDGSGCVVDGKRYRFVGCYGHASYGGIIIAGLRSLARAYTLTEDRRYAHRAALLLLRIASEYPNASDRRDRTFEPGYGPLAGMYTGWSMEWAAMRAYAMAYDEVFATIPGDAELLAYARGRLGGVESGADLQEYIEDRLLRPAIQAVIDGVELVNFAGTEETIVELAIALADAGPKRPNSVDAVEWMYHGGGRLGDVGNQFYKDGSSYESLGYNNMRQSCRTLAEKVRRLKELLPGRLPEERYPDILKHEKVARFDEYRAAVVGFEVGDGGAADMPGAAPRASEFLDGYGMAFLRSGSGAQQRTLCLAYSTPRGHAHYDLLTFLLNGMGRQLLRNLQYPPTWAYHRVWEQPAIRHNQVVVDRQDPCSTLIGSLEVWAPGGPCQVLEISKRPYRRDQPRGEHGPDVKDYRRMVALADLEDGGFYAVDLFRVTGGRDHLQSWHTVYDATDPVRVEGCALSAPESGTLAGPGVPYGSLFGKAGVAPDEVALCFLKNVRRGPMSAPTAVTWKLDGANPVLLRLTFLPLGDTELVLTDGGHPVDPEHGVLQWAMPHRAGAEGLASQFLTVVEPYAQQRILAGIRLLPVTSVGSPAYPPIALEVSVSGGRDLWLFNAGDREALQGEGFALRGRCGWIRERGGKVVALKLVAGTQLVCGDRRLDLPPAPAPGRIIAAERGQRTIVVAGDLPDPAELAGRRIQIDNHGGRQCSNTVVRADAAGPGALRLVLDTDGILGEGTAAGFEDGIVRNAKTVLIPMAGLVRLDDGRFDSSDCLFSGARLENGVPGVSYRVRGVLGFPYQAWGNLDVAGTNHVYLEEAVPAAELRQAFAATPSFRLYEYGVGDAVTFDRVKAEPPPGASAAGAP